MDAAHLPYPATIGVLLAGGLARRMGGGDKALRLIGGQTLLARATARLAPQCAGLIVNADGDPARFAGLGLPVVPDTLPDHPGPLAGVLAALDWVRHHRPGHDWVVSVPTDAPFLPRDLVARLHQARIAAGTPLACAGSGGRVHPVVGLWPVALAERLRHALTVEEERRVGRFAALQGVAAAEWASEPLDPFFNLNRPEDLAAAEAALAATPDA
ncbi:molybdenum cofactor guanylyltransferase MobA [Bosea sp. TWI1241]|uniref:molybdenum cofactor guanylyltransferase MobA n=1 Tax=Bosea sp. TWI1241 TaxID=3148904 RepID=UPI00320A6956